MSFLKGLLIAAPKGRPSAQSALQHTWIVKCAAEEDEDVETSNGQTRRGSDDGSQPTASEATKLDHLGEKIILADPPLETELLDMTLIQPILPANTFPKHPEKRIIFPNAVSSRKQPEDNNIRAIIRQEAREQRTKDSNKQRIKHEPQKGSGKKCRRPLVPMRLIDQPKAGEQRQLHLSGLWSAHGRTKHLHLLRKIVCVYGHQD